MLVCETHSHRCIWSTIHCGYTKVSACRINGIISSLTTWSLFYTVRHSMSFRPCPKFSNHCFHPSFETEASAVPRKPNATKITDAIGVVCTRGRRYVKSTDYEYYEYDQRTTSNTRSIFKNHFFFATCVVPVVHQKGGTHLVRVSPFWLRKPLFAWNLLYIK